MSDILRYRTSVSSLSVIDLLDAEHDEPPSWDGAWLRLEDVGAALAVCTRDGLLVGTTPAAIDVLARVGLVVSTPQPLPAELWALVVQSPVGVATEWAPTGRQERLGCTAYPLRGGMVLLLMREVSSKQRQVAQRLHRQRLESMGRLVATLAHDLRAPLAPIVFNAEALLERGSSMPEAEMRTACHEISQAAASLRGVIDGVLHYAKLGPPRVGAVSLRDTVGRAASLLRASIRDAKASLQVDIPNDCNSVVGSAIAIEQIVVNLLLNALEAPAKQMKAHARRTGDIDSPQVELRIEDDGPGIPEHVKPRVFDPFFTTKPTGTGLGLGAARDAARDLGGDLHLDPCARGACFVLTLPSAASHARGGP